MNRILKKIFSVMFLGMSVGLAPFSAHGSWAIKNIDEEKKPFKESRFINEPVSIAQNFEQAFWRVSNNAFETQKRYEYYLSLEKSELLDENCFWVHSNVTAIKKSEMNNLVNRHKRLVFESGSIGVNTLSDVFHDLDIRGDENTWIKQVFPLVLDDGSYIKDGFKLVVINQLDGRELIFYFKFGNNMTLRGMKKYDLKLEIENYNTAVKLVSCLKPLNLYNVNFKKIEIGDIKQLIFSKRAKNIKPGCFSHAYNLETVDILKDIFSVSEGAFFGCISLKKVNFHGTVYSIDKSAFKNCYFLEDIYFPEGLRFVGDKAFYKCCRLKRIGIPLSTEIIHLSAFDETNENLKIIYGGIEYSKKDFLKVFFARGGLIVDKKLKKLGY